MFSRKDGRRTTPIQEISSSGRIGVGRGHHRPLGRVVGLLRICLLRQLIDQLTTLIASLNRTPLILPRKESPPKRITDGRTHPPLPKVAVFYEKGKAPASSHKAGAGTCAYAASTTAVGVASSFRSVAAPASASSVGRSAASFDLSPSSFALASAASASSLSLFLLAVAAVENGL